MLRYLVIGGAVVSFWGGLSYLRDTVRGRIKPNRITFLMWATAPLIGAAAAYAEGVRWAVLPVFMAGFTPLLIFLATFVNPNAYWKLGIFDYACGAFSLLALILWGITREPIVALVFALASDGFALIPTLVKSWQHPKTESGLAYGASLFNALTSFFAIQSWVFAAYAFPIYLVLQNSLVLIAIYRKRT